MKLVPSKSKLLLFFLTAFTFLICNLSLYLNFASLQANYENRFPSSKNLFITPVSKPRASISSKIKRPCGQYLEINKHYVDRNVWDSISNQEIEYRISLWKKFLFETVPSISYQSQNYKGRGIIFTSNGYTLERALISINFLRKYKCRLPIEVWYFGDELSQHDLDRLSSIGVYHRNIAEIQQQNPTFKQFYVGYDNLGSRNYQLKTLAILLCSFEEILYLDSDNIPLRDPSYLFEAQEFIETGAVFWNDFWKFPQDNPFWKITLQQCVDEWEQESGQLLINKEKAWKGLLLSLHFQMNHDFYFSFILGDKDTFRFGFKVTSTPYYTIPYPVAVGGRIRQNRFCGHSMIQPDFDGTFTFVHTTAMKTTKSTKLGNTWESIQYLLPKKTSYDSLNPTKIIADYPFAVEYSGGIDKTAEEGGKGIQLMPNPCLEYRTQSQSFDIIQDTSMEEIDSYSVVTEDFSSYGNDSLRYFENDFYFYGGLQLQESSCGHGFIGNGKCPLANECCSPWGWCGSTVDHCGLNCKGGPCFNTRKIPKYILEKFQFCGNGNVGFGLCENDSECCSRFGWCSSSSEHCRNDNCLSGPCMK